ncbi:putative peptide ABC transporter permease protein [Mobilicoccus pelagius NBRC 104925]|uniref:Putative peptide ABC transporter permease protein n=2 Tax=Mobilicoccus TaxID=984996 RepID=H5URG0_9MICO|nr:putative peptide ABC transporter permease protein [Mobilicoccus pelagius NBRC 104925]
MPRGRDRTVSPTRAALHRALRGTQARAGLVCLGLVLGLALLAPLLVALEGQHVGQFDGAAVDAATGGTPIGPFGGVSSRHWLGVEPGTGRDLLALIAYGTRTSIGIAAGATLLAASFGVLVGLAMGYSGGWFEAVMGRFVDFMFGFPSLLFLIAVQLIVPPEFPRALLITLALAFFGWVGTARLVHGQAAALSRREFVLAARASGTPVHRILTGELLPNLVGTVVVVVALQFPGTVGVGAGLSFLGIGVGPQTPELGRLIGQSITWTYTGADPWYLLFPGATLFLLVLGSTLLGDSLRDAFDVRLDGGVA